MINDKPKPIATLAYTAGIVDGEGCITIAIRTCKRYRQGCEIFPTVVVGNSKEHLIKWLQAQYGGYTHCSNQYRPSLNRRVPFWVWGCNHRKCVTFLKLILPYLFIKAQQAKIAIELGELKKTGIPLTKELMLRQQSLTRKMHNLNHNGKGRRGCKVNKLKLAPQGCSRHSAQQNELLGWKNKEAIQC